MGQLHQWVLFFVKSLSEHLPESKAVHDILAGNFLDGVLLVKHLDQLHGDCVYGA